jgi:hypothetical protein
MKKLQLILLMVIAGFIAFSDPYGLAEDGPQKKNKKKKSETTQILETNLMGEGQQIRLTFIKGKEHNHPLMAVWVEDTAGNYIQTLYVAKSIATGLFNYGDASNGAWTQGSIRRPAALPYWSHKRGIKAEDGLYLPTPDNPVADAYTGATPKNNFDLITRLDKKGPKVFNILFEINQPWDWNEYWSNAKYPDDDEYKTSSQPALVYQATIDLDSKNKQYKMHLIGHSHYSGSTGELFTDTSTLTTALEITKELMVIIE